MPVSRRTAAPASAGAPSPAPVPFDRQARIAQLQAQRHALLRERGASRGNAAELELRLAIIRAELQALYHTP